MPRRLLYQPASSKKIMYILGLLFKTHIHPSIKAAKQLMPVGATITIFRGATQSKYLSIGYFHLPTIIRNQKLLQEKKLMAMSKAKKVKQHLEQGKRINALTGFALFGTMRMVMKATKTGKKSFPKVNQKF